MTHALLRGVQAHRARVAVIDLAAAGRTDAAETASQPEDDATPPEPARTAIIASHLVHAARATRLLGASVVFSSPSPSLASAVTQLGAGVTTMRIAPDLSAGIREAERMLDHIIPTHAIAQDARWFTRNA